MISIRSKLSVFSYVLPCIYHNILPFDFSHIAKQPLTSSFRFLNPSKSETFSASPKWVFSFLFFSSSAPTTPFRASSHVLRLDKALTHEKNGAHFYQLDVRDHLTQDVKTILDILCKPGCGLSEIVFKLDQCGIRPSSELVVEILLRVRNVWEAALTFFLWAGEQPGYSYSIREFHLMISILGKMRKFDIAWALIGKMRGGSSGPSLVTPRTLLIMIRRYCAIHDVGMAINTFHAGKQFNFQVGLREFQSLLSALCDFKNVRDAEKLLFHYQNVFPFNTKSFNIILDGWCNVIVSPYHAQRIWHEMSKRGIQYDVVSYASIISCYSKASKLFMVLKLLDQMRKMIITPNRKVYNAVIHGLAKARLSKEAVNLMRIMEEDCTAPNITTYNSLIKALCKADLVEDAKVILNEMLQRGISPTIQTYHALFRVLRTKEEVIDLWNEMREEGCHPTIETYIMLIRRFCQWRHLFIVYKLWSEMIKCGFYPDHSSYTALIHGLFLNRKLEDAFKYYLEMQEKGFRPEWRTEKMIWVGISKYRYLNPR